MKKLMIMLLLVVLGQVFAAEYKIELSWDQFSAECNGILSGTIDNQTGMVQGIHAEQAFNGKIKSSGETGMGFDSGQTFMIDSETGYFSFWIRDKFSDDDMNADMNKLSEAKPVIKIWRAGNLIEQIAVPEGQGLVCKVFNLDIEAGEIDQELRYFPRSRMIIGMVVDCVSGETLSDVSVSITDDMGKTEMINAGTSGIFTFPCEIGKYNLAFSKPGYVGIEAPVEMGIDEAPREIVVALSEEIKNYRIVLTWGSRPKDLDAHLSGPNPDGGDFHIWWRDHYPMGGKDFLDRDDRSSYGPETITIYKPAIGTYQYSVFDYSNRGGKRSTGLERSGARVEVYGEKRLIKSFNIPAGKGDCWHVFKIDESHNIIPINTISYVKDDRQIHEN